MSEFVKHKKYFLAAVGALLLMHLSGSAVLSRVDTVTPRVDPLASRIETTTADDQNIEKLATKRVQPPYPPLAQKYRIEGVVVVQVVVGKDGSVGKAEFVRGHNIFRSVSLDAAKKWEFKHPSTDNLEGTIHFTFKLSE
jgi:TonB family protein